MTSSILLTVFPSPLAGLVMQKAFAQGGEFIEIAIPSEDPFVTNQDTITINGTAEGVDTVSIFEDLGDSFDFLGSDDNASGGEWSITVGPLDDGFHDLIAANSCSEGVCSSPNDILTVRVDTSSPVGEVIINEGDLTTTDPNVRLELTCNDFEESGCHPIVEIAFAHTSDSLDEEFPDSFSEIMVFTDGDDQGSELTAFETGANTQIFLLTIDLETDVSGWTEGSTVYVQLIPFDPILGTKIVNATFHDNAGNIAQVSDSIVLIEDSLTISILATDPSNVMWGSAFGVNGTTAGAFSGLTVTIHPDGGLDPIGGIAIEEDGSWELPKSDGIVYDSSVAGMTLQIVAKIITFDPDCFGGCVLATSDPFEITVGKLPTEIQLDYVTAQAGIETTDLDSIPQNAVYSVTGTLYGITEEGLRIELGDRPITFPLSGPGNLDSTTTGGLVFEHPTGAIEVVECPIGPGEDCSEDTNDIFAPDPDDSYNNVLHLGVGGKVIFAPNTLDGSFYVQGIGYNIIRFKVYDSNGLDHEGEFLAGGSGECVVPILQTHVGSTFDPVSGKMVPEAVTVFEVTEVLFDPDIIDPDGCHGGAPLVNGPQEPEPITDGTFGIAAVVTHIIDGHDPFTKLYLINFENEEAGPRTSPYQVNVGRFLSSALATSGIANDYLVIAHFAGDELYESSSAAALIDVIPGRGGLTSTISGSVTTAVTPDAGNDFVTYSCAVGNDIDNDAVCDNWETSGIVDIGGASYVLCDTSIADPADMNSCDGTDDFDINTKDIYVEVDAMAGFAFSSATFNEIMTVFNNNEVGVAGSDGLRYRLHIDSTRGDILPASFPTKIWTDSSSAKLGGTQTNSFDQPKATTKTLKVSGLKLSTTGPVTDGKITIKQRITLPASLTASIGTPSVDIADGAAALTLGPFSRASITPGSSATTHTITYTIPFTTTSAISNVDLGRIKVTLTLGNPGATLGAGAVTTAPGSPIITSNDDFDGIKKNYFGTEQERFAAGGTLGQEKANLKAKAYVSHYAIIVRTMGPDKATCGSSGWAEYGGNDFIIALGPKNVNGLDVSCFTGTAGSASEQKGTFLHELGHNLRLRHNGYSDDNCAPNYTSLMSYTRQIALSGFGAWRHDYSRSNLADLDERVGGSGILESNGLSVVGYPAGTTIDIAYGNGAGAKLGPVTITRAPINWDGDNLSSETLKGFDINYFATIKGCDLAGSLTSLQGNDDYETMNLNFRDGNPIDGVHYPLPIPEDIDDEVFQSLIATSNNGLFGGLLPPIMPVTTGNLEDATKVKSRDTVALKFQFHEFDGNIVPDATFELRLYLLHSNGDIKEGPITPHSTPPDGTGFRYDAESDLFIYNLSTHSLKTGIYGAQIVLIEIDDGGVQQETIIDNDTDAGFAGYFRVMKK